MIGECNETDGFLANGCKTVCELLDLWTQEKPNAVAFSVESQEHHVISLTYKELSDASYQIAAGLHSLGITEKDRVLVQLPNCVEIIVAWFGIIRLGAIFVPSNPVNTHRELSHIIELADIKLTICQESAVDTIRLAAREVMKNEQIFVVCFPKSKDLIDFESLLSKNNYVELSGSQNFPANEIVELIFTSGTSATPKAVMVTHANCLNSGFQKSLAMEISSEDVLLTALPFFHVNAQSAFLAALTTGSRFVLLEKFSSTHFFSQLARHKATLTSFVGTQVRILLSMEHDRLVSGHNVKKAWFALELTEVERDEFRNRFGITLFNGYGLTEAFTSVTQTPLIGRHAWPSVGLPLNGRKVRIIDNSGVEVSSGIIGEIAVGGEPGVTLMKGYWNDSKATESALRNGWLHTGDLGKLDEYGFLYFVSRKSDLIKRAGENISSSEVESVLLKNPYIKDVAVIGIPDFFRDEAVTAFIVLNQSVSIDDTNIKEFAENNLASFKVPTVWRVVESLPRDSLGKIQKALLKKEGFS